MDLLDLKNASVVKHAMSSKWGSQQFNFATHESIYCLFPQATLERKEMTVVFESPGDEAYRQYVEEGYKPVRLVEQQEAEFTRQRYVGDFLCRRVEFSIGAQGVPSWLTEVKFELISSGGIKFVGKDF